MRSVAALPPRSETTRAFAVTAHAGSLGTAANTPDSFRAALSRAVDALEADVRFAAGGAPYLAHDALPPALQGSAMGLAELLRIAAAHPTARLNLDLKEYSGVRPLAEMVRRCGMGARVLLTGVTAGVVAGVRADADGLPYLLNASPTLLERRTRRGADRLARRIRECGALGLNTPYRLLTPLLARRLREAGLQVSVWTVDGERAMRRMIRLGVDNITTRNIDRLLALRQERSR